MANLRATRNGPLPLLIHQNTGLTRQELNQDRSSTLRNFWLRLVKYFGTAAPSSSSATESPGSNGIQEKSYEDTQEVDEIIVDRTWSEGFRTSISQSEHGDNQEKLGRSQRGSQPKPASIECEQS